MSLRLAIVAGVALLIGGCGFHLQGRTPLPEPLKVTYVLAEDSQSEFVLGLRKALLSSGAKLARLDTDATGVVQVLTDEVTERILSVSASNIPREYELTYTVRFSVRAGSDELLPPQEVALTRDYSFDERTLLAKEHEEAILREALARDLVGIVMRRLASL
jgi:LPS-assembly lipoprotein